MQDAAGNIFVDRSGIWIRRHSHHSVINILVGIFCSFPGCFSTCCILWVPHNLSISDLCQVNLHPSHIAGSQDGITCLAFHEPEISFVRVS